MIKNQTVILREDALEAARTVHQLHLEAHARREALQKEFQDRLEGLGREYAELLKNAWGTLLEASGLPGTELDQWELDATYLRDHQCAFLKRNEPEETGEAPNLADLLQAAISVKH